VKILVKILKISKICRNRLKKKKKKTDFFVLSDLPSKFCPPLGMSSAGALTKTAASSQKVQYLCIDAALFGVNAAV